MKQDSRAAAAAFLGSRFIRPRSAAAFAAVSSQQASDDGGRAADSRLNADCARRAVLTARAAFHARVEIYNHRVFAIHFKYMVWADLDAHAAAGAFFFVHLKGCDTFQIREISHFSSRDAALRSLCTLQNRGLQPLVLMSRHRTPTKQPAMQSSRPVRKRPPIFPAARPAAFLFLRRRAMYKSNSR